MPEFYQIEQANFPRPQPISWNRSMLLTNILILKLFPWKAIHENFLFAKKTEIYQREIFSNEVILTMLFTTS
ncbi:MAG: hypothetical protein A1D16_19935 [Flavihumibacter sp. CACIAM 22H1]|nr:MAG: hypothetical protein A1D16_19935 [Flavihumibacter sp. CACIAM 22H1]